MGSKNQTGRPQGVVCANQGRKLMLLAAVAAVGFAPERATAGSTWIGAGGNLSLPMSGLWNVAANWSDNAVPASDPATQLNFTDGSSSGYVSTNNIAGAFILNTLKINSSNSTIAANAGASLSFGGTAPAIQQSGAGTFTVSAPIGFSSPTVIQQVGGAALNLTGNLSGSGVTIMNTAGSGNSIVKFSGANTHTSLTVGANVTAISANSANATTLGAGPVNLAGGKLALQGRLSAGQAIQQPISVSGFNAVTIDDAAAITNGPTNSAGLQLSEIDNAGQVQNSHLLYQNGYSNSANGVSSFLVAGGWQGGLPSAGTFSSASLNVNGGHTQFNFAYSNGTIDYTKNNSLYFTSTTGTSGNVTLPGPAANSLTLDGGGSKLKTIDFLADAQNPTTLDVTVNFADGGSTVFSNGVTTGPWAFGSAAQIPTNIALSQTNAAGSAVRFKSSARNAETGFGWRLTENDITLSAADQLRTVTGITFTPTDPNMGGGKTAMIFAVSGEVFQSGTQLTTQAYANDLSITADSTIDISGSLIASMGGVSIGSNKLSVTSADATTGDYSLSLGTVNLSGAASFDVADSAGGGKGTLRLGALNDAGVAHSVSVSGTGTVCLVSDAASLVSGTVINLQSGTLNVNSPNALGGTAQVNITGGTYSVATSHAIASLSGTAGTVALNGNALTIGGADNVAGAFGGKIIGTGSVTVGGGTVTLSGNNTFSGGVHINGGAMVVAAPTTVTGLDIVSGPVGPGTVSVGGSSGSLGTQLLLDNTPGRTLPNLVSVSSGNTGTAVVGGLNTSGVVTYQGDIVLGGGSSGDYGHDVTLGASNGGQVNFDGNIIANLNSAHSAVTISNLSGTGSAVVKLNGANNNYAGGTVINPHATLVAPLSGSTHVLGSGSITLAGGKLALQGQQAHGAQQTIAATGYNNSLIVPVGAASAASTTTSSMDGSDVFYQNGYVNLLDQVGTHGLNDSGHYTSLYNPGVQFQLQPYSGSNALVLKNAASFTTSGSLTLATPGAFKTINLLSNTGNIFPTVDVTFNFDDSTTETQTIHVGNWFFNGSAPRLAIGGNRAEDLLGSISRTSGSEPFNEFPGSMYEDDLTLLPADQSKNLASISFQVSNFNGGGQGVNFFAVSGESFVAPTTLATQTYNNAVAVTADSSIDVSGSPNAVMGGLTMGANALSVTSSDVTTSPYSLAFSGTITNDPATFNVSNSAGGGKGNLMLGMVNGSGSITKSGNGRLVMSNAGSITAPKTVNGGIVEIDYTGGNPIGDIRSQLALGFANGAWNGAGINSTAAALIAADSLNPHKTALGYANASDVGESGSAVLIRYTLAGDANLDGLVTTSDFTALAAHFNASGQNWIQGDFNYDGVVNALDFNTIASNFGAAPVSAPALGALVPEPALAGTIVASIFGCLVARRRARSA